MGISLRDRENHEHWFEINFWNWRPIVEAIRWLAVLPDECADGLHEPFCGNGLTRDEALLVADALEARFLPRVDEHERVLLDLQITREPDDQVFHRDNPFRNYGASREAFVRFIAYCRACQGFDVL
jgi:hypothetical protein